MFVRAISAQFKRGSLRRRQHHHAHNTFRVDFPTAVAQPYIALESRSGTHHLGCRSRMQPEHVQYLDLTLNQGSGNLAVSFLNNGATCRESFLQSLDNVDRPVSPASATYRNDQIGAAS